MTQVLSQRSDVGAPALSCAEATVLVIDDDPHFRHLARHLLAPDGIQVLEAECVRDGLAWLQANLNEASAVVMDLVLPDEDGIEAIREVKDFFPDLKVIAVSGVNYSSMYLKICKYLGADAVLSKLQIERLPELLASVL